MIYTRDELTNLKAVVERLRQIGKEYPKERYTDGTKRDENKLGIVNCSVRVRNRGEWIVACSIGDGKKS